MLPLNPGNKTKYQHLTENQEGSSGYTHAFPPFVAENKLFD